jgi:hypothetical protein
MEASEEKADLPAVQGGYMAMIERLAENPTVQSVEVIERMMAMQEKWEAKQAEKAFNEAMARIAKKLADIRIVKSKSVAYDMEKGNKAAGQKEAFRYTPLDEIDKIVRPLLIEEELSVSYTTETREGGGAVVIGRLSHAGGHYREASIPLPLDNSGGKSNVQGMGSTFSYGRRYTLCMLLNIITLDDDDGSGGPVSDEQAAEIKKGLKETGLDIAKFLKTLKAESVEAIRARDFKRAITAIDARRWQIMQEQKKGNASAPAA